MILTRLKEVFIQTMMQIQLLHVQTAETLQSILKQVYGNVEDVKKRPGAISKAERDCNIRQGDGINS